MSTDSSDNAVMNPTAHRVPLIIFRVVAALAGLSFFGGRGAYGIRDDAITQVLGNLTALHTATTCRPLRAINLNDPLAASVQCRGQSGTEAGDAFDGPQPRAVAPPEADQLAVAGRIRGNRQISSVPVQCRSRRPPPRCGVVMGVNADDDVTIWMDSQHAVRSFG